MKQIQEFYNGKKILVTGGAGFIGSYIVEELIKNNACVTIIDNFSSGNLKNLKNVFNKINIIYGDITNIFTCTHATKNQDIVFHLAALVSVSHSIKNPQACEKINTLGTQNILEGCVKNGVKTIIFSSSAAIYGNKNNKKCEETDSPSPLSPYAKSKLEGELLCKKYSEAYNINSACLRYFNVFGERQNPNGEYAAVVAKFKNNLEKKKPLIIFGDGMQTRDFIHVSEVTKANLYFGSCNNIKGEIFNIASGKSINLLELIEKLEKELNMQKTELIFQPAREGDINNSEANCKKYKTFIKD